MHILYLHQHFVARSGTSGGRSYEFSQLLIDRGHRVTMICGDFEHSGLNLKGRSLVSKLDVDGISVRAVRVPYAQRLSTFRRIGAFFRFMVLASWVAARVPDVDVVFATSTPLTIAVPGIVAALRHRRPLVFEVRDLWPQIPIDLGVLRNPALIWVARLLEKIAYKFSTKIVALSPGMKEGVVARGTPEGKVVVIPNSSDVALFRVAPEEGLMYRRENPVIGGRPLIVYAGAFGRINGLEYLLDVAREFNRRGIEAAFWFIGAGSEREALSERAAAAGLLNSSVFFRQPVPRSELPRVISAATILTSCFIDLESMQANSANKFFDAFAAGKPIAINYLGWHADLLRSTGAGLVMDPQSPQAGAGSLARAIADPRWLSEASMASSKLGLEKFDRRVLVDQFEDVLFGAATKSRSV